MNNRATQSTFRQSVSLCLEGEDALVTDRLREVVSDPDVPCSHCMVMPKSTCCIQLTGLDPGSELNLAQTSKLNSLLVINTQAPSNQESSLSSFLDQ